PPELEHPDVGGGEVSVAPLLPPFGAGVKVEADAERAGSPRHRQARTTIAERLAPARVHALKTVDLAPRYTPSAPVPLQVGNRCFECSNSRPRRGVPRGLYSARAFK